MLGQTRHTAPEPACWVGVTAQPSAPPQSDWARPHGPQHCYGGLGRPVGLGPACDPSPSTWPPGSQPSSSGPWLPSPQDQYTTTSSQASSPSIWPQAPETPDLRYLPVLHSKKLFSFLGPLKNRVVIFKGCVICKKMQYRWVLSRAGH